MRATLRRDMAEGDRMTPNAFGNDPPNDCLAAQLVATPGEVAASILDADDDFDPDELYLDLGVGD